MCIRDRFSHLHHLSVAYSACYVPLTLTALARLANYDEKSGLGWLSGRCTGLRRALRRSFCAVRVFPFDVALAAPGPVPRGLARFALAVHSRLASTQEQAAAPRQREQRVSATLSKVEETQRQSAETRCLRCRSGLGPLSPCVGGPGPHRICRPAPLPLRRLSWQCRPTVCCGSRRALT